MTKALALKEADLARLLVQSLLSDGWEVYEEVVVDGYRIDVVATQGPLVVTYECKLHLNLDVIGQAEYWKGWAHQSWVVTPWVKATRASNVGQRICRVLEIGHMVLNRSGKSFETKVDARLHRKSITTKIQKALVPEQLASGLETGLAGTNKGGYSTPFSRTVTAVQDYLQSHNGRAPLREVMDNIKHHYSSSSSARSTMRLRVLGHLVPGVKLSYEGKCPILEAVPLTGKR